MLKQLNSLQELRKSTDGNVAITSALALPVVLLMGMSALDYGLVVQSDQDLKAAAAAAALAAVNEAHIAFLNDETVDLEELMQETAEKTFAARTGGMKHIDLTDIEIIPSQQGNTLAAEVIYKAVYNTKAMNLVGQEKFNIANKQRATISTAKFINITLLFDGSSSMGVGATTYDQHLMQNTINCTFACHGNTYNNAKAAGATMRIDVAREAAADSIEVIRENVESENQVTVGIYRYGGNVNQILDFNHPHASDLTFVENKIRQKIFLQPSHMGTNTEGAIQQVAADIPDSGLGRTPDDRVQYLVVLTDGVEDVRHGGSQTPNSPNAYGVWAPGTSGCQAIRDRGIKIFFIQTEYLTPTIGAHQYLYQWIDANLNPILDNRFAACAGSMDYVFQTTTPQEIQNAFLDVMGDISSPLRLY